MGIASQIAASNPYGDSQLPELPPNVASNPSVAQQPAAELPPSAAPNTYNEPQAQAAGVAAPAQNAPGSAPPEMPQLKSGALAGGTQAAEDKDNEAPAETEPHEEEKKAEEKPEKESEASPAKMVDSAIEAMAKKAPKHIEPIKAGEHHPIEPTNRLHFGEDKDKGGKPDANQWQSSPIGTFAREIFHGSGAGAVLTKDQNTALMHMMGLHAPGQEWQSETAKYEAPFSQEEKNSVPYQGAKAATQGAAYLGEVGVLAGAAALAGGLIPEEGPLAAAAAVAPRVGALGTAAAATALGMTPEEAALLGSAAATNPIVGSAVAVGAQNALASAAFSAERQLKEHNQIDAGDLGFDIATDAALNLLVSKAALGAGSAIKAAATRKSRALQKSMENLAEKTGKSFNDIKKGVEQAKEVAEKALSHLNADELMDLAHAIQAEAEEAGSKKAGELGKLTRAELNKMAVGLIKRAQAMEHEAAEKIGEMFGPPAPEGPEQEAQKAVVDTVENVYKQLEGAISLTVTDVKEAVEALQGAGVTEPYVKAAEDEATRRAEASPREAPFRRPLRPGRLGFDAAKDAYDATEAKEYTTPELYKQFQTGLKMLGDALSDVKSMEQDVKAYGKNMFELAVTRTQRSKVQEIEGRKLKSGAKQGLEKEQARLLEEQQQENIAAQKEKIEAYEKEREEVEALPEKTPKMKEAKDEELARINAIISDAHAVIEKINNPEKYNLRKGEHVYAMADGEEFAAHSALGRGSDTPWKGMATTFDEAAKQFVWAKQKLKDLDAVKDEASKALQPILKEVKKAYAEFTEDPYTSPAFNSTISHPYSGKVTTTMTTQLRFGPSEYEKLVGQAAAKWNRIKAHISGNDANVHKSITHDFANSEAEEGVLKKLQKAGLLDPRVKKALSAAIFTSAGLAISGGLQGAEAATNLDEKTEPQQEKFWGNVLAGTEGIGTVVLAGFLTKRFGAAGARMIGNTGYFVHNMLYQFTVDGAFKADQILGRELGRAKDYLAGAGKRIAEPAQSELPFELRSMSEHLRQLRGLYVKVGTLAKAYKPYFVRTLQGELDGKNLDSWDQTLVDEINGAHEDTAKFVQHFHDAFAEKWKGMTPDEKLKNIHTYDVVRFLKEAYGKAKTDDPYGKMLAQQYADFCRGTFVLRADIAGATLLGDAAGIGMLSVGPGAYWGAYKDLVSNEAVRDAAFKLAVPHGWRAEALGAEAKPLLTEKWPAAVLAAASARRYYKLHQDYIKSLGMDNPGQFLTRLADGDVPDALMDDATCQIGADCASAGFDPLGIEKSFIDRSKTLSTFMKFNRQQGLEGHLVVQNVQLMFSSFARGEYRAGFTRLGWLAGHTAWKVAYGGAAALPASAVTLGMSNPITIDYTSKVVGALNDMSVPGRIVGSQTGLVQNDYLYPITGSVGIPGIGQAVYQGMQDNKAFISKMGKIGTAFENVESSDWLNDPSKNIFKLDEDLGNLVFTDRLDEDLNAAHKAIGTLLHKLPYLRPLITHNLPTRSAVNAFDYIPDVVHGTASLTTYRPGIPSPIPLIENRVLQPVPQTRKNPETGEEEQIEEPKWMEQFMSPEDHAKNRGRLEAVARILNLAKMGPSLGKYDEAAAAAKLGANPDEAEERMKEAGWAE